MYKGSVIALSERHSLLAPYAKTTVTDLVIANALSTSSKTQDDFWNIVTNGRYPGALMIACPIAERREFEQRDNVGGIFGAQENERSVISIVGD